MDTAPFTLEITQDAPAVFHAPSCSALFDLDPDWKKQWEGMPEYYQENKKPYQSINVHFKTKEDRDAFAELVGQKITDQTKGMSYPKVELGRKPKYECKTPLNPRHPIYIISKGRWKLRSTSKALEKMRVPYRIVIEPQEYEKYAEVIDPVKILTLPFSNLGQGSIPARNWVWEHSLANGDERHWIMDDNIHGFMMLNRNSRNYVNDGTCLALAEDFVGRYENIGLAGLNYRQFGGSTTSACPPFQTNTRVYSCILIRNDIKHRWRGKYNEDTDLSIRVMKDGLCTVLFQAFLIDKTTTMRRSGGNSDELYQGEGRKIMAESLAAQHPEIVTVTRKFNRWQHHVDYSGFKRNELILRKDAQIGTAPVMDLIFQQNDVSATKSL
jgi:hypothetical protein